jgi:hypothetical protein
VKALDGGGAFCRLRDAAEDKDVSPERSAAGHEERGFIIAFGNVQNAYPMSRM